MCLFMLSFNIFQKYSSKLTQYSFEHFGGFKLDKVVEELERGKKCVGFLLWLKELIPV